MIEVKTLRSSPPQAGRAGKAPRLIPASPCPRAALPNGSMFRRESVLRSWARLRPLLFLSQWTRVLPATGLGMD